MTEINYPPSRTYPLADARDACDERIVEIDEEIEEFDATKDIDARALAEKRAERNDRTSERDALAWAIDEFGADAELTIEAFTTAKRSRTLDTANRKTMGQLGNSQLQDWLLAAAVADAPWLEGGEDLHERYQCIGALPPALADWLNRQLEDINDLSEGNS